MNKSKIAVAVVVGIGILWTGGAWYTGKQAEQHIDQVVAQVNQQLSQHYPEAGLVVSRAGYQRHIFSSETQLIVKSQPGIDQENALLAPNEQWVFNEKISHGPFPLAQLKQFNLLPALASVHSELSNTPAVKSLFELSQGKSPFTAETRIGYGKSTASDIRIVPIKYQAEDSRLNSDAAQITLKTTPAHKDIVLAARTGNLVFSFKNESGVDAEVLINGVDIHSDSHLSKEGLRVGTQNITLNNFAYSLDRSPLLQLSSVQGHSDLDSKNNLVGGKLSYQVGAIKWHQLPLGSASLNLTLKDFDATGVKTFYDHYNQAVQKNMANIAQVTNQDELQAMQNEVNAAVLQNIPNLLKGAPHFTLDNFSLKNDKGESQFSLNADFNDPTTAKPQSTGLARIVDGYIKQLNANLSINKPMAVELLNVIAQTQGIPAEQAAQFAQQQVDSLASMGDMYHLTTAKDDSISSALNYSQGQISINNNKLSLEQFVEQYLSPSSAE